MGYYPSKSNKKQNINLKNHVNAFKKNNNLDLSPMEINIIDSNNEIKFNKKVYDEWINHVASIGTHNSLMQYSFFINNRISYQELTMLSTDDLINNAIQTITRECLNKWGDIKINSPEIDISEQETIINTIKKRFLELNFNEVCYKAIQKSLIYGGIGLYLDTGSLPNEPLKIKKEFATKYPLKSITIIEPYLFAPQQLNLTNPLLSNFMMPNKWYVSGVGEIDSSRLYTMIFFDIPYIIKPMYNCLGISLCQLMKDKVKSAESIRQSLTDLMLRFKTDIIKTPLLVSNANLLKDRVDLINLSKNNLGTLVLNENEEYINSVTAITGLDKIQAQAFENVASSARLPAVKLLGLTPSGFNATGEFDLKNYYDVIRGYQNNTIKPFINQIIKYLLAELGYDDIAEFEFSILEKSNELENSQIKNYEIDAMIKLVNAGLISPQDAFNELQNNGYISKGITFNNNEDDDLNNLNIEEFI